MSDAFLSYSRRDIWVMRTVFQYLQTYSLDVWVDEKIEPGTQNWKKEITNSIDRSDGFIIIISPDSIASKWVNFELDHALNADKVIYPILSQTTANIPDKISAIQYADIRFEREVKRDFKDNMYRLVARIFKDLNKPIPGRMDKVASDSPNWNLTGSLFWLGSDMRSLMADIKSEKQGNASKIRRTLHQCIHHANLLNISKDLQWKLANLEQHTREFDNSDWTKNERNDAWYLANLVRQSIGQIAADNEGTYDPGPRWKNSQKHD